MFIIMMIFVLTIKFKGEIWDYSTMLYLLVFICLTVITIVIIRLIKYDRYTRHRIQTYLFRVIF